MNSMEHLELIEFIFDRIEQAPEWQGTFRFVGFTQEGEAHTFYLNSLKGQKDREVLIKCLHNSITFHLLNDCIRDWIEIFNYYLVLHEAWEKIQAEDLNMDTVLELIRKSVQDRFESSFFEIGKLVDYGLQFSLGFINAFIDRHDGLSEPKAIEWDENDNKELPETNYDEDPLETQYKELVDDIVEFISAVIDVRERHWRLRKRALQDLIEGKVLKIDPKQFQMIQELLIKFQQEPKTSNQPLWLRTALEENLLNDSGNDYYFLTKDNVRAFWKVLHTEIEKKYESSHDPRGMAIDQMPTPELAHQLIKRKDGKPYSVETFKSARKKI